jgi:hypothetical protein
MKDKSTGVLLAGLFGILGLAIIVLAWVRPMPESERILTMLIGLAGLLPALGKGLFLRGARGETDAGRVLVRVEDKP